MNSNMFFNEYKHYIMNSFMISQYELLGVVILCVIS